MPGPEHARWAAVDWGTTNLRVWVIGDGEEVIAHGSSNQGMARLSPSDFEPVLVEILERFLRPEQPLPVLICGMAGAHQGWVEAPYLPIPCAPPTADRATCPKTTDPRLTIRILPGLSQAEPADVMRGEETQLAGLLAQEPDFEGAVCLPGTHTKWVRISAGRITHFQTFMTGELFDLLARHSVLRHMIADDGWDDEAFLKGVADAAAEPDKLAAKLFSLRAEGLLAGLAPTAARARLSGLLIGVELATAGTFWQTNKITVIGASSLAALYTEALARNHGATVHQLDAEAMTLAGLAAAVETTGELTA